MAFIGRLEIEVRMFYITKNEKWRWWKFWEPKELKTLTNETSMREDKPIEGG